MRSPSLRPLVIADGAFDGPARNGNCIRCFERNHWGGNGDKANNAGDGDGFLHCVIFTLINFADCVTHVRLHRG
jgi:hypothetical protein